MEEPRLNWPKGAPLQKVWEVAALEFEGCEEEEEEEEDEVEKREEEEEDEEDREEFREEDDGV